MRQDPYSGTLKANRGSPTRTLLLWRQIRTRAHPERLHCAFSCAGVCVQVCVCVSLHYQSPAGWPYHAACYRCQSWRLEKERGQKKREKSGVSRIDRSYRECVRERDRVIEHKGEKESFLSSFFSSIFTCLAKIFSVPSKKISYILMYIICIYIFSTHIFEGARKYIFFD